MRMYFGIAALALACGAVAPASAQNAMKVCGAKYQAAKTAKTLPTGQTWNQFLSRCRAQMAPTAAATPTMAAGAKSTAPVAAATTATRTTTRTSTTGRAPTAGQLASRDRERACGAQWRAAKAAGKVPAGQKWPQYWSQCNARMK